MCRSRAAPSLPRSPAEVSQHASLVIDSWIIYICPHRRRRIRSRGGACTRTVILDRAAARGVHAEPGWRHLLPGQEYRARLRQLPSRRRRHREPQPLRRSRGRGGRLDRHLAAARLRADARPRAEDSQPARLQRQPGDLGAHGIVRRALHHRRCRRPDPLQSRRTGHRRQPDVLHRQRRGRREVVRPQRPLGTPRRLPVPRGSGRKTTRRRSSATRLATGTGSTEAC